MEPFLPLQQNKQFELISMTSNTILHPSNVATKPSGVTSLLEAVPGPIQSIPTLHVSAEQRFSHRHRSEYDRGPGLQGQ